MFTGIITHLGKVKESDGARFTFEASVDFCKSLKKGSSVSVNGACLTAKEVGKTTFTVDLIPETLKKTAFSGMSVGDLVNLELSMKAGGRFDGHILLGHVDFTAEIDSIKAEGNSKIFKFSIPVKFSKYMIEKGSVAVNGISLTVIEVGKRYFSVGIIPYTMEHTTLKEAEVGDQVNVELDVIGKYVEKLIRMPRVLWVSRAKK